ncbi:uncharacterized protein LOC117644631 [Thrips palmi]|uniref:Uncharacterized protein LOC117644631 n=1 Tax=Thrips palmi TaxID=161013 RepID=A0A6P8YJT7_THRPL|nr:uncharacterized protein LOC117644631 [Thrips palmi]
MNTYTSCPSDGSAVVHLRASHFRPARPYDLQVITSNLSLTRDVEDNFWLYLDLAVRNNNEWKENAFIVKFANIGCTTIRDQAPGIYGIIAKSTGAPTDKNKRCFIPKGQYDVNGPVNWTLPNFPIMPYGRYRIHLRARGDPNSPVRYCAIVDCEAIPKPG